MQAKLSTNLAKAPEAHQFPEWPAAWYLFGHGTQLRRGPVSKTLLGRRLVAFRGANGKVAVLNAHCAHQGADLGRGQVVGDNLECPYHQWCYNSTGQCVKIPGTNRIPKFACVSVYPTVERHGSVFFFNGPEPLLPLPFFPGEHPEHFVAGRMFSFEGECPWYLLVANGFDTQHFRGVHDRTMIGNERVDAPAPLARRIQFDALITGGSVYDRALRACVGDTVQIAITSWGGPFVTVTGRFKRATSYLMIAVRPLDASHSRTEVIVFVPRQTSGLLRPMALSVRRWFTKGFMSDDFNRLTGICYNAATFIENDHVMVDFLHWLAALPQTSKPENP